jgi:hypothetical protein
MNNVKSITQGLLFEVPALEKLPGSPSQRCLEALKILNNYKDRGVTVKTFGETFYWRKGWRGLQLQIQSLAYLRILVKKELAFSRDDFGQQEYRLTMKGENVLQKFTRH